MNLIKNALVILAILSLAGCSIFSKPVEVEKKAVERLPLNLNVPTLENLQPPKWHVITPDIQDDVWAKLTEQNDDEVLIGLTDGGYVTLATLIKKIISHIEKQKLIIQKYKDYYEPKNN